MLCRTHTFTFSGLWFLWPTNASKNSSNVKEINLIPSITEMADKTFEMGKYEESYNLLIKYKVIII